MQNHYVADIGDYGKLGLLRELKPFAIGINWYLTPDEDNGDGRFTDYLDKGLYRDCDPELWDSLRDIVKNGKRNVASLRPLLSAEYYDAQLDFSKIDHKARKEKRANWHRDAMQALSGVDVVFADPDNGLMVKSAEKTKKSCKYITEQEALDYFRSGKSIIYYQHKARFLDSVYAGQLSSLARIAGVEPMGLKFTRTSIRYYFFLIQKKHKKEMTACVSKMLESQWANHFCRII